MGCCDSPFVYVKSSALITVLKQIGITTRYFSKQFDFDFDPGSWAGRP